jgi:hypothetical protein
MQYLIWFLFGYLIGDSTKETAGTGEAVSSSSESFENFINNIAENPHYIIGYLFILVAIVITLRLLIMFFDRRI